MYLLSWQLLSKCLVNTIRHNNYVIASLRKYAFILSCFIHWSSSKVSFNIAFILFLCAGLHIQSCEHFRHAIPFCSLWPRGQTVQVSQMWQDIHKHARFEVSRRLCSSCACSRGADKRGRHSERPFWYCSHRTTGQEKGCQNVSHSLSLYV